MQVFFFTSGHNAVNGERLQEEHPMRRLFIAVAAVLALIALGSATAADRAVTITRTGFVPADVTIAVGDSVTWRNTDTAAHQVVFTGTACNLTIQPGASGSCTFR